MVSMRPWLSVVQDDAPAHIAAITMEDMSQRLIQPIFWPANSPDLNPIEAVWIPNKLAHEAMIQITPPYQSFTPNEIDSYLNLINFTSTT
ncbi:Bgt-50525 [Blumeria graminis f. sp. tritici]|uniref:Bgt-50525 n=1 Tax=Blumeria graminis f. sp. tritici TaxID=62690 RepID=A0A9X9MMA2_BLUGR|nr:Bgt-50525 [Blumeria graminis f. sp. tritici]